MNEEEIQLGLTGDPLDEQEAIAELEAQDITPDEAAASLSFANTLQERFMEQEAMMSGGTPEEHGEEIAQEETLEEETEAVEEPVVEEEAVEEPIDKEAIKAEIKAEILEELSSALADEDEQD